MNSEQLIEKVGRETFMEIENMGYKRGVGTTMYEFSVQYFLQQFFLRIFGKPYCYDKSYMTKFFEKVIPYVFLGFVLATLLFLILGR